ncbi:MAG TPA: putative quinol monooxygenase [Burkholderiales bacterium]|nr:putative quinol monooxygenase [Burkholderiales bacterium]
MLHVMAIIRVQPEHCSTVSSAMMALATKSRAEPGCVRYDVFQRRGEPVLMTQESWADAEAEAAHMSGSNVAAAFTTVGTLLAAAPEIHHYSQLA